MLCLDRRVHVSPGAEADRETIRQPIMTSGPSGARCRPVSGKDPHPMRILFIASGFNSLSQRLFVELTQLGHEISVELDIDDATSEQAVDLFAPDLILAPFLKRAIPESIFSKHLCLIVHPGIPGDRGPAALDWAILNQEPSGVSLCCRRRPKWMRARSGRRPDFRCARRASRASIATR